MSLTVDLTGHQLLQLDALLADTTPGAGLFRPPVARDIEVLRDLETAGLSRFTIDCGYEITDAGKAAVIDRAMDEAASEAFVRYASNYELREAIRKLKAVVEEFANDDELRERTLTDLEACQDELDRRANSRTCWAPGDQEHDHEMCNDDSVAERAESTGRHRAVPADERPTETIDRVELPTEPMPIAGTLPDLPIVPSDVATERFIQAIKSGLPDDDVFDQFAAEHAALEADLGDDRSWLRRNLTPRRTLVLSIVATVVVTWFVAWLVMG